MVLIDFIKKLIRNYFIIFSIVVICITLSCQILFPDKSLSLSDIYTYMICSLIVDLLNVILYSSRELSEKQMWIRKIVHFIVLNIVLLIFANWIGFINDILDIIVLEIQIVVIYVLVNLIVLIYDKKAADEINEKLNIMRKELKSQEED